MKKIFFLGFFILNFSLLSLAQEISVANDRMNIFYAGIDNPVSIAVSNLPFNSIIVKATNGIINKKDGYYLFHSDSAGITDIILYKKENNKLKQIGKSAFRIKLIPPPIFKMGSGKSKMSIPEISAQQFVRADLDNFDIDVRYLIKRYSIYIISNDTCSVKKIKNNGNKLSDETLQEFKLLKDGDILLFKDIFIEGFSNDEIQLEDRVINVYK